MKDFVKQNRLFLILYLLFLVIGGIILARFEKGDEILYFNQLHTSTFDFIFTYFTQLAEAPVIIFLVILLSAYRLGNGLLLGINALLVLLATAFLKQVVFASQVRPSVFFEGKQQLNFVQGLPILHQHSFPSGHTAGAFAMFFLISLMLSNKRWGIACFILALGVGVSRVYLLQHFFRDVYFGSLVAVVVTSIFWLTFVQSRFYANIGWKDKGLFNR